LSIRKRRQPSRSITRLLTSRTKVCSKCKINQ
jgi:hypothetical protein